ncbi:sulfurtransferase [Bacillus sp. FJAT-29790]|uniref:sulfurtransferase n=1 Tax=Bacillus sp. FJAT-29790 TaxID=1895002 RepID=UPI001C211EBC|nr:sulfurtransferase [Bacillus sp. FJAT-29790]MBU8879020.1 sulfurtransferase [Bacillus sp. FJAT-29790]
MKYFVDKEWVLDRLDDGNIRMADCRYNLSSSDDGYESYLKDHIPGAVYFHLGKDLAGPVLVHGGRHPLPDLEKLRGSLQKAGINKDTTVIAYDGGEGAFAARLWWLLKYVGHENVFVLDGGYKGWIDSEFPVSSEIPTYQKKDFDIKVNEGILASYEEVKKAVNDKDEASILIDSRDCKRYLGIEEPIDRKAGHIPGAINKVWSEGYEQGFFKPSEEQEKRFTDLDKNKQIIVYCGSGITATPNFIALKAAGFENVKLYAGSFSDWITYDENDVETGE